jgi:hypothetical protein
MALSVEAGRGVATGPGPAPAWAHVRRPWGRGDLLAVLAWTAAVAVVFRDAVTFHGAFFYFDITEINYPYRDFLAGELRAGRFSRWHPGLYCGFPLFSESQAGYLHPLKYLLYPWMATWRAFNLDTVLSVWLAGLGTYGWLRRHVGPVGALCGAGVFGLGGFVWAHLIHTSMLNALVSVPLAVWALECAWEGGRARGLALGGLAIACQVFAGHLQDTLLTAAALGLYGLYRAATERGPRRRLGALTMAATLIGLGVLVAAVQWIPSKELLDRSPRAGGLDWDDQIFGSWSPELLPTLLVREAYGTRARDTDWMDGFYPYHEMNIYMGIVGLGLAMLGAAAYRDRWVGFWVLLAIVGTLLMLGRYSAAFDVMPKVPLIGSSRIPVRYHLWVALAVAALAGVGADRLVLPGRVRLRGMLTALGLAFVISVPILIYVYAPVWTEPNRWTGPEHIRRYNWLAWELSLAAGRTLLVGLLALWAASRASRTKEAKARARWAAALPILLIADLYGSHYDDAPTIDPSYWTRPPVTARRIKGDPGVIRVEGTGILASGEPGFAWGQVDFLASRDTLAWSLPPVWGLRSGIGETPIRPRRFWTYSNGETLRAAGPALADLRGLSYYLSPPMGAGRELGLEFLGKLGHAFLYRNPTALPRARLVGLPEYARDENDAQAVLLRIGPKVRDHVIVEDPDRPLPTGSKVAGTATIAVDLPERVEVATDSKSASYLVLADSFDPGWSATVDGRPAPVRPAYITFRAVYLPAGSHRVVFTYTPAGFRLGAIVTAVGLVLSALLIAWPRRLVQLRPEHEDIGWPRRWPWYVLGAALAFVIASAFVPAPASDPAYRRRWHNSVHRFTWGSGLEAIRVRPKPRIP